MEDSTFEGWTTPQPRGRSLLRRGPPTGRASDLIPWPTQPRVTWTDDDPKTPRVPLARDAPGVLVHLRDNGHACPRGGGG
jgi:hypothetical protein